MGGGVGVAWGWMMHGEMIMLAMAIGMTGSRRRAEAVYECWKAKVGSDGLGNGRSIRTIAKNKKIARATLQRDYLKYLGLFQVLSGAADEAPPVSKR